MVGCGLTDHSRRGQDSCSYAAVSFEVLVSDEHVRAKNTSCNTSMKRK
jgi:hypothetical protein